MATKINVFLFAANIDQHQIFLFSPSGLFVRKMVLLFNKMSFGQVLHLTTLLKTYLQAAHVHSNTDSHMSMEINGYTFIKFPLQFVFFEHFEHFSIEIRKVCNNPWCLCCHFFRDLLERKMPISSRQGENFLAKQV